jgi:hypothetical protein
MLEKVQKYIPFLLTGILVIQILSMLLMYTHQ